MVYLIVIGTFKGAKVIPKPWWVWVIIYIENVDSQRKGTDLSWLNKASQLALDKLV